MNETTTIINTAFNNFMEGTNFNYLCKPTNEPTCRENYILPDPITVNGLPQLADCSVLVTIPGLKIANSSTKFCELQKTPSQAVLDLKPIHHRMILVLSKSKMTKIVFIILHYTQDLIVSSWK
jgi:hypothetical protein